MTASRVRARTCPIYSGNNPEGLTLREMTGQPIDCIPAFREPGARVELLDELGVQRALMFPTIANLVEYTVAGDPDLTHAAIHAINHWLHDQWTFDYASRIFATPVITLPILEEAITELEWVLERGAKIILVRPAPANGLRGPRSIALPEFDPFWARVQEAGIPVAMHASFPPLTTYYETWEPGNSDSAFKPSPLKELLLQHREIEDAIAAMICEGALSRFPDLRVLSVENGAAWVGHLQHQLDSAYRKMPQEFAEHPVEVFRRNVYVNPFWEDDVAEVDRAVWARPRALRLRLPAPRGSRGTARLPRHAAFRTPRRRHHPSGDEHQRERAARPTHRRLMDLRLDGKVAIVTGSTKGIGRVIAARFAAEGAKVVVAGRSVQRGEDVAAAIRDRGGSAIFVPADVSDEAQVETLIARTVDTYGALTTLVNNAASTDLLQRGDDQVTNVDLASWEKVIRTTLTGTMLMCRQAIPRMIDAGGGSIVNISSDSSQRAASGFAAYGAAGAAVYFASDDAEYVTATMLSVDGGGHHVQHPRQDRDLRR